MRNLLFILFVFTISLSSAQDSFDLNENEFQESEIYNSSGQIIDSSYVKDLEYVKDRAFKEKLDAKYSGKEFTYIDELKEPKKKPITESIPKKTSKTDWSGFFNFMSAIFPFLLGFVVVLIIIKSFMNTETGFWNLKSAKKENVKKLISEEEILNVADYEILLQQAIQNHDFRLATRFYYLILLNNLSEKNHIEYHKEKTNSEYLFELRNKKMRSNFSYLSYIYSYVWYGEFPISKMEFNTVEKKYKSFIETIK